MKAIITDPTKDLPAGTTADATDRSPSPFRGFTVVYRRNAEQPVVSRNSEHPLLATLASVLTSLQSTMAWLARVQRFGQSTRVGPCQIMSASMRSLLSSGRWAPGPKRDKPAKPPHGQLILGRKPRGLFPTTIELHQAYRRPVKMRVVHADRRHPVPLHAHSGCNTRDDNSLTSMPALGPG